MRRRPFRLAAAVGLAAAVATAAATSETSRIAEEHYRIGLYFLEQGLVEPAIGHLYYVLGLVPEHRGALAALSRVYAGAGTAVRSRALADHYLSRWLALEPDALEALRLRAAVRTALGRNAEAERDARHGLALAEDDAALGLALANALFRQGRFDEAAAAYEALRPRLPDDPLVSWNLRVARARGATPPPDPAFFPPPDDVPSPVRFVDEADALGIATPSRGRGNAWADVDGDGDDDLFATGIRDPHALYRNEGGGRFVEVTDASGLEDPRGGWAALAFDAEGDGDLDLYVTRDAWSGPAPNSLYINDGRGVFRDEAGRRGALVPADSFTAAAADYDRDGDVDLYVANGVSSRAGAPNALLRNRGDGTFEDVAAAAGVAHPGSSVGCAWGDVDGDGHPDLYVANYGGDNALFRNRGDGRFEDVTIGSGTVGPRYAFVTFFFDYDNDARLDLFVAAWTDDPRAVLAARSEGRVVDAERRLTLYHNEGGFRFRDATEEAGLAANVGAMSAAAVDLDNDGYLDLVLGTGGPQMDRYEPDVVYWNRGDGTFAAISHGSGLASLGKTHGITAKDVDGDGDLDLYASVGGQEEGDRQRNAFFRNAGGTGHHWIAFRLEGDASNAGAVGARVTLRAGGLVQVREKQIGGGFGSTNGAELHFGLGRAARVDGVAIAWPSGARQELGSLAPDRVYLVREGRPAAPAPP